MDSTDEDHTVRLLRLAGARPSAPDARAARVRAAVHHQWALGHRRRTVRRRLLTATAVLATAAALIVVVGRALRIDRAPAPTDQVMAVVERIDGNPRRSSDMANSSATSGLSPRDVVRAGEWIEADPSARVALRFSDGTSVRLDRGSRARVLSARVIELSSGAVDPDTDRTSGQFEVRTAVGTARDVGTQFEVRLIDMALRLRVRTGCRRAARWPAIGIGTWRNGDYVLRCRSSHPPDRTAWTGVGLDGQCGSAVGDRGIGAFCVSRAHRTGARLAGSRAMPMLRSPTRPRGSSCTALSTACHRVRHWPSPSPQAA